MKKILVLILFTLLGVITKSEAQTNINPYIGTWQYQNGNQVFMVKFWNEDGMTVGRYKLITVNANGQQTGVVYTSKDKWGPVNITHEIYCGPGLTGPSLTGIIHDTTIVYSLSDFVTGDIKLDLISGNTPITASWKVVRSPGIKIDGEPDFNIPLDIVLTKVSNFPYAD